ncbi:MAG: hypothetical protein ACI8QZ_001367 [Chlamydiales bacterium]
MARTFVRGFNTALLHPPAAHAAELDRVPLVDRGFAFEGLAMALAVLDLIVPGRRRRWRDAIAGIGADHIYMMPIGYGLGLARLRRRLRTPVKGLDPMRSSLAADGYGFHHGFFTRPGLGAHSQVPGRVSVGARRAFDQGYGRSLWFVHCADPERLAQAIGSLPEERRAGTWSGVGLAAAYAGGVPQSVLESLLARTGGHAPSLAQGAGFAAECRARAGNPAAGTDLACGVICGVSAEAAVEATREASSGLAFDDPEVYENWRARLRRRFEGRELV